jgi:(R)-2-hydroxyacyl-CoA dehydratese activating ATPase
LNRDAYFAGIDLGSGAVKVVVMTEGALVASRIMPAHGPFEAVVAEGLKETLSEAGRTFESLDGVVVTGYGNYKLPFLHQKVSPLSAGARGALFFCPDARTVIDVGVQQSSVVKLDDTGNIADSMVSEKCAAGSGWFLKVVARVMGLPVEGLGSFSLRAENPVTITTDCAVFAETEVISRVAEGNPREDIIAGAHNALAHKIKNMAGRIGLEPEIVLIGGTGKDAGFVKSLREVLGVQVTVPEEPRLAAAIGAILFHHS